MDRAEVEKQIQAQESIAEKDGSDIINSPEENEDTSVHIIGKINRDIYKCITDDIVTDEVVITEKQILHVKSRHPNNYELYSRYLGEIVLNPDYIIRASKPNTALILKEIEEADKVFKLVLRLVTSHDDANYKNSIITFMKIDEKEWNRMLRNKFILYKKR